MGSRRTSDERAVTCQACGTENNAFYTYCRSCLGSLPSRPRA
ncbi:DUF7577 domain-containing protein [Natrarchaeobaculum sulfurireducens]